MKKFGVLFALMATVGLGGCALDGDDAPRTASEKTTDACKSDVDRAFLKQNRAYLSEQNTTASPFSSTGMPGLPTAGLGDEYGRDQAFDQCVKGSTPGTHQP